MSKKNSKKNETATKSVGRPRSKVSFPSGKFSVAKLAIHNHVTDENGALLPKGERRMSMLTLRHAITRAIEAKEITLLAEVGKVKNEVGLGRPPFLYMRTSQVEAGKRLAKAAKASKVNVPVGDGGDSTPTTEGEVPVSVETPSGETNETPVASEETVQA